MGFTSQSIIVWTLETKSLLPSLYSPRKRWRSGQKRVRRFAGFGKEGPFDRAHGHELVERLEEISGRIYLLNHGLLGI